MEFTINSANVTFTLNGFIGREEFENFLNSIVIAAVELSECPVGAFEAEEWLAKFADSARDALKSLPLGSVDMGGGISLIEVL